MLALFSIAAWGCGNRPDEAAAPAATIEDFVALLSPDPEVVEPALQRIRVSLPTGTETMLMEAIELRSYLPTEEARNGVLELLREEFGLPHPTSLEAAWVRIWNEPYAPHPDYMQYKSQLMSRFSDGFSAYFQEDNPAPLIRLDEIRWGGVPQDGIPPLKDPSVIAKEEAEYLAPTDVVFGVIVNGESRCYPKRILAWHEMVKDELGGVSITGVYCTLCGSMIVYFSDIGDQHYELGTSGLLYRSNKLMYDNRTQSLWSTLEGKPVVGELVGKGIQLQRHPVVTTTWETWRNEHPETTVLSLDTGYNRDYGEGVAYRDYFSTDRLMFAVPSVDSRLKNKAEVVALSFPDQTRERLAVACEYLARHPIHQDTVGSQELIILTDTSGASRVYETGDVGFAEWSGEGTVRDENGQDWKVTEEALVNLRSGQRLDRLPSHRAFWFGWYSAFPDTRLVH